MELYQFARQWRVPMAPISMPGDVLASEQLIYRKFFVAEPNADKDSTLLMPGAPYKMFSTPWQLKTAAPDLGSDNEQFFSQEDK